MASSITYLFPRAQKDVCKPQPLKDLFQAYQIVLAGDELGAFYLDKWATLSEAPNTTDPPEETNPIYPWGRRSLREAKVGYMELVYAAHESGAKDIVIDMDKSMQPGIDTALSSYTDMQNEKDPDVVMNTILYSDIATPMDAVVKMAGVLGMKVHALNTGLTGLATFYRLAKGKSKTPENLPPHEQFNHYVINGLHEDIDTLSYILRRAPTKAEIEGIKQLQSLCFFNAETLATLFDEKSTVTGILNDIGDKPFLGFFQNERLFTSEKDIDGELRSALGHDKIVRMGMCRTNMSDYKKPPQFYLQYAIGNCAVMMTRTHAEELSQKAHNQNAITNGQNKKIIHFPLPPKPL